MKMGDRSRKHRAMIINKLEIGLISIALFSLL
jgi:hypothetical protein